MKTHKNSTRAAQEHTFSSWGRPRSYIFPSSQSKCPVQDVAQFEVASHACNLPNIPPPAHPLSLSLWNWPTDPRRWKYVYSLLRLVRVDTYILYIQHIHIKVYPSSVCTSHRTRHCHWRLTETVSLNHYLPPMPYSLPRKWLYPSSSHTTAHPQHNPPSFACVLA